MINPPTPASIWRRLRSPQVCNQRSACPALSDLGSCCSAIRLIHLVRVSKLPLPLLFYTGPPAQPYTALEAAVRHSARLIHLQNHFWLFYQPCNTLGAPVRCPGRGRLAVPALPGSPTFQGRTEANLPSLVRPWKLLPRPAHLSFKGFRTAVCWVLEGQLPSPVRPWKQTYCWARRPGH